MGFRNWVLSLLGGVEKGTPETPSLVPGPSRDPIEEEAAGLNFFTAIEAHQKWKVRLMAVIDGDSSEGLSVEVIGCDPGPRGDVSTRDRGANLSRLFDILPPVKVVALGLALFFVVVLAGAAFGIDLGCADDCGDGDGRIPCQTACASCLCNPVVPASDESVTNAPLDSLTLPLAATDSAPLRGVVRSVLHVPLAA